MSTAQSPPAEVEKSRRNLPHWDYGDSVYFVTWRIHEGQPDLKPQERQLICQILNHFHGDRYHLFAYVVMNDHIHVLFRPLKDTKLAKLFHTWKSYSANQLQREFGRKGRIWQDEHYDRVIRNKREFYDTAKYILNNPKKRWKISDYEWMGYRHPNE